MLPAKVDQGKGKVANVFGTLFGDKSLDFATGLLNEALKNESDTEVKTEIERRIKLIKRQQAGLVQCNECKRTFKPVKTRNYKQYICRECFRKRFGNGQ